jgi:hypothetical protein
MARVILNAWMPDADDVEFRKREGDFEQCQVACHAVQQTLGCDDNEIGASESIGQNEKVRDGQGDRPARADGRKGIVDRTTRRPASGNDKSVRVPAQGFDGDRLSKQRMALADGADITLPVQDP